MSEEIRERKMYQELLVKKASADKKISEISEREVATVRKNAWLSIAIVAIYFIAALVFEFSGPTHGLMFALVLSFMVVSFYAPKWRIAWQKGSVCEWWDIQFANSLSDTQCLFVELQRTAKGSRLRQELQELITIRLATRRVLHQIVDALKENFSTMIPCEADFDRMVFEEIQCDREDMDTLGEDGS